ncbi:hypothetical protein [Paenibacillus macerans]|uniref:hypothetical protein n=1 Tax=Paenibacillus macerans TaxID=44252 RepID=UPI00203F0A22|nr:hypothetical protein [Paenibacillus macerans]MCM3697960.1 hypothetical protein [Paenibacillus macerans]
MLDKLIEYLKLSPVWSLAMAIAFTALVWLYKEFKGMMEESNRTKLSLIQKRMDLYAGVEAAIAQAINKPEDSQAKQHLYIKLGEASSYFTRETRQILRDYYSREDAFVLDTLLSLVQKEIDRLDRVKEKLSPLTMPTDVVETVSKLFSPLKPIIFMFAVSVVAFFYLVTFLVQDTTLSRMAVTAAYISLLFSMMLVAAIISLLMEGHSGMVPFNYVRSVEAVVMLLTPIVSLFFLWLAIPMLLLQILSFVLFAVSQRKEKYNMT